MHRNLVKNVITAVAVYTIIIQSLTPLLALTPQAFAQTATPTPTVSPTPTDSPIPTIIPTPVPTDTPTPTPTPTVEPTPTFIPTPTPTPTPTVEPTPTVDPSNQTPTPPDNLSPPASPDNSSASQVQGASTSPTPTVSPTPTPSPEPATGNEQLNLVILKNTAAPAVDLFATVQQGSATLTTNKPDYAPTDTALITGSNLLPNTTYSLRVWSDDAPATSTTVDVTSNDKGEFAYAYQLDGTYRPNYSAELKDSAGNVVATTTFTDSVTVTAATGGTNISNEKASNGSLPAYTTLGDIVINENSNGDFSAGADKTLILSAPTGWIFSAGTGNVSYRTSRDITSSSISVVSSNITITYSVSGIGHDDRMTISGIQVQATDKNNIPGAGNILRTTVNPGTGIIGGITNGTTNFGSLSQAILASASNSTVVASPTSVTADGISASTITVTLKDGSGNPVSGKTISLAKTSGSGTPTITTIQGVTDASGIATFTVKSTTAATNVFTATDTTDSLTITQTASVSFTALTSAPNPSLGGSCGLDVALVLDNSGSVGSNLGTMKTSFKNFIDALSSTPTQFSVTYFNDTAHLEQVFSNNPVTIKAAIDNVPAANGSTNWQDGLLKAKLSFDPRPSVPNLIVFSSDGDPNRYYTNISDELNPTGYSGPGNGFDTNSHNAAISLANTIKGSGTRIITLGIGGGSNMQSRMVAISSTDAYFNASNFDTLSTALNQIITSVCGGTISVNKYIDSVSPSTKGGAGWTFTASGPTPKNLTSDLNGQTNTGKVTAGTYSITETNMLSGYGYGSAVCKNQSGATVGSVIANGRGSITVGNDDVISCDFVNTANYTPTRICHATGNPDQWVSNTPATLGQLQGHVGAGHQNGNDIIPPIPVFLPSGQNWDTTHIAIYNNDCNVPPTTGTIELKKAWVGTGGQTTLNIGTSAGGTQTASVQTGTSGGAPLTTGVRTVNTGTYYVSESGGLTDYTSALACTKNGQTYTPGTDNSLVVAGNDVFVCTFTNTKKGHLQVTKVTDPSSDTTTQFSITASGSGTISGSATQSIAGGQTVDYEVTPGTYSVSEAAKTGWDITGNTCSQKGVSAGQTVTCTITNTQRGSITVTKFHDHDANGTKDSSDEVLPGWTINLTGQASQPTDSNGQAVFGSLVPGSYDLSEEIKNNWFQSNISCTGDIGTDADNLHTIRLTAGQNITCLIGNYQNGHIVVTKDVVAPNGNPITDTSTSFPFAVGGSNDNVSLTDGQSHDYLVAPGLHTVAETTNGNYDFVGCDNGITSNTFAGTTVTATSGATINVTCTNKQKTATITVIKDVTKSDGSAVDDNHLFHVTLNGETKDLAEGTNAVFTVNPGGPYAAVESADDNYTWVSQDGAVTVGSGGSATIHIVNKQNPGTISGTKSDTNGKLLSGWTMQLISCLVGFTNCADVLGATTTTDSNGFYQFTNLVTGFYQVREILQAGWTNITNLVSGNITINPGTTSTGNNFVNFQNVSITACKQADPDGNFDTTDGRTNVSGWHVNLMKDGLPTSPQVTGQDGCYTWTNLGPGSYGVGEAAVSGWQPLTPTTHDFGTVQSGSTYSFTFVNYPHGSITVHKQVDVNGNGTYTSGDDGDFTWKLTDINGYISRIMGDTDSNVPAGQHSVEESDVSNYHFTGWFPTGVGDYSCTNLPKDQLNDYTQLPINVNVGANGTSNFTLCNARDTGTITVNKVVNPSVGDNGLFNLQINGQDIVTDVGNGGTTGAVAVVTGGGNSVGETAVEGTDLANYVSETSCVSGNRDIAPIDPTNFNVSSGENITCTITNTRKGKIIVTKYNDINGDGKLQEGEGVLSGWTINLGETSKPTLGDGTATFDNLTPDSYFNLSENLPNKSWKQTSISCDTENSHNDGGFFVSVNPGETVNCSILNHNLLPKLTISKSNDALGSKSPGDVVNFTITITNDITGGEADNVKVVDLLPKGFHYNSGTAALDGTFLTGGNEPVYASPGKWTLPNMTPGTTLMLTYSATIDSGQQAGTYYDTAWGQGTAVSDPAVILASADPVIGYIGDPNFVGTKVPVEVINNPGTSYNVISTNTTQSVLGASTGPELPSTGEPTLWVIIAALMLGLGAGTLITGFKLKKKYE